MVGEFLVDLCVRLPFCLRMGIWFGLPLLLCCHVLLLQMHVNFEWHRHVWPLDNLQANKV